MNKLSNEEKLHIMTTAVIRITHHYQIGNQDVFIRQGESSVDVKKAAAYLQLKYEEFFGYGDVLSNFATANILITFYGFSIAAVSKKAKVVDMYFDREFYASAGHYGALMADPTLHRDGLKEAMLPYFGK